MEEWDQTDFLLFFFFLNMSLKRLNLSKNHFKTNLFFSHFGGGEPPSLDLWSDSSLELPGPLEEPSGNCQMTHIIQNSFHAM